MSASSVFTPVCPPVQMAQIEGATFFSSASRSLASCSRCTVNTLSSPSAIRGIIGPVIKRSGLGIAVSANDLLLAS